MPTEQIALRFVHAAYAAKSIKTALFSILWISVIITMRIFLGMAHHAKERCKGFVQTGTKPLHLNKARWP